MIFTLFYIQIFIHILYSPHSIHPPVPSSVFFLGVPGSMLYIRLFFSSSCCTCMYVYKTCMPYDIYIYYYTYIYKHPKNRKVVHHYFSRICIYIYIIQFFLLKPWVYIYIHTLCFPLCFGFILAKRERLPRNLYDASGRQSEFLDLPRPMTFWVNGSHMGVSYKMRVPKNVEKGWFIISL